MNIETPSHYTFWFLSGVAGTILIHEWIRHVRNTVIIPHEISIEPAPLTTADKLAVVVENNLQILRNFLKGENNYLRDYSAQIIMIKMANEANLERLNYILRSYANPTFYKGAVADDVAEMAIVAVLYMSREDLYRDKLLESGFVESAMDVLVSTAFKKSSLAKHYSKHQFMAGAVQVVKLVVDFLLNILELNTEPLDLIIKNTASISYLINHLYLSNAKTKETNAQIVKLLSIFISHNQIKYKETLIQFNVFPALFYSFHATHGQIDHQKTCLKSICVLAKCKYGLTLISSIADIDKAAQSAVACLKFENGDLTYWTIRFLQELSVFKRGLSALKNTPNVLSTIGFLLKSNNTTTLKNVLSLLMCMIEDDTKYKDRMIVSDVCKLYLGCCLDNTDIDIIIATYSLIYELCMTDIFAEYTESALQKKCIFMASKNLQRLPIETTKLVCGVIGSLLVNFRCHVAFIESSGLMSVISQLFNLKDPELVFWAATFMYNLSFSSPKCKHRLIKEGAVKMIVGILLFGLRNPVENQNAIVMTAKSLCVLGFYYEPIVAKPLEDLISTILTTVIGEKDHPDIDHMYVSEMRIFSIMLRHNKLRDSILRRRYLVDHVVSFIWKIVRTLKLTDNQRANTHQLVLYQGITSLKLIHGLSTGFQHKTLLNSGGVSAVASLVSFYIRDVIIAIEYEEKKKNRFMKSYKRKVRLRELERDIDRAARMKKTKSSTTQTANEVLYDEATKRRRDRDLRYKAKQDARKGKAPLINGPIRAVNNNETRPDATIITRTISNGVIANSACFATTNHPTTTTSTSNQSYIGDVGWLSSSEDEDYKRPERTLLVDRGENERMLAASICPPYMFTSSSGNSSDSFEPSSEASDEELYEQGMKSAKRAYLNSRYPWLSPPTQSFLLANPNAHDVPASRLIKTSLFEPNIDADSYLVHDYFEVGNKNINYDTFTLENDTLPMYTLRKLEAQEFLQISAITLCYSSMSCNNYSSIIFFFESGGYNALLSMLEYCPRWIVEFYIKPTVYDLCSQIALMSRKTPISRAPYIFNPLYSTAFCYFSLNGTAVRNDNWTLETARIGLFVDENGISSTNSEGALVSRKTRKWVFEVVLESNGVIIIGWSNKKASFVPERGCGTGSDANSYGWDVLRCKLAHNKTEFVQPPINNKFKTMTDEDYGFVGNTNDRIYCYLNIDDQTISYQLNNHDLGIAFKDINPSEHWYPTISIASKQQIIINTGTIPFSFSTYPDYLPLYDQTNEDGSTISTSPPSSIWTTDNNNIVNSTPTAPATPILNSLELTNCSETFIDDRYILYREAPETSSLPLSISAQQEEEVRYKLGKLKNQQTGEYTKLDQFTFYYELKLSSNLTTKDFRDDFHVGVQTGAHVQYFMSFTDTNHLIIVKQTRTKSANSDAYECSTEHLLPDRKLSFIRYSANFIYGAGIMNNSVVFTINGVLIDTKFIVPAFTVTYPYFINLPISLNLGDIAFNCQIANDSKVTIFNSNLSLGSRMGSLNFDPAAAKL